MPHPYLVLGLLTAIYTFNFMDRQIISILAEPIKHDLSLSDTQLGLLGRMFFALFYTTLGIPVAWFADKSNRIRIVAVACTVWSACSMLCGLAGNFTQLALGRIGVGAGEAGGTPPAHSLLSDYIPRERRGTALAIYSIGVPLGILLASLAGGAIAATYGWRAAFLATGAPGILFGGCCPDRDPRTAPRALDGLQAERLGHVPLWQAIRMFLANRTLLLAALAAAASAFVGYALNWMPALLIRNKGMNMGEIALWHSLVTGIGSVFGTFVSGWIADRLAARSPGAYG